MPDATNIKIGDMEVYFEDGPGGDERNIGHTKDGSVLTIEREFTDLTVDKYGSAPVDKALIGNKMMIKVFLAEPTTQNQGLAVPEGAYASNVDDSKLGIGRESGFLLSSTAAPMRLHPRRNSASDLSEDIYIFKASSVENVELNYKIDEQRGLEITFEALVDESQPNGQHLGRIGDPDIS